MRRWLVPSTILAFIILLGFLFLFPAVSDTSVMTTVGSSPQAPVAVTTGSSFPIAIFAIILPAVLVFALATMWMLQKDAEKPKNYQQAKLKNEPTYAHAPTYALGDDGELIEVFEDEAMIEDYHASR